MVAENRIAPEVLEALRDRGHRVEAPAAWTMQVGGMQAVALAANGLAVGAADPRQDGYAVTG